MSKLKCAVCRFAKTEDGEPKPPTLRNAEYIWEGVSVCEEHLLARRAMLILGNEAIPAT